MGSRVYTVRMALEFTASRRIDIAVHKAKLTASLKAAAPAGWTVAAVRVSSRKAKVVRLEAVAAPVVEAPVPLDPLRRIDPRIPCRVWMGNVLAAEGMARWTVLLRGRRGKCWSRRQTISLGRAGLTRARGLEYVAVQAWLLKRGANPEQVDGLRYMALHEIAHGLAWKRRLAGAPNAAWMRVERERPHGTRFRRALLGLLLRWAPEAFVVVAAAGPQQEVRS